MAPDSSKETPPPIPVERPRGRGGAWLALAGLFLVVFAAKLWLIGKYGNSTPSWDQWNGEAGAVLIPHLENHLRPAALFQAHNEHRIFFTRVLALGLFEMNGIWDPKVAMVVQASIHAGCIALLVGLCGGFLRVRAARLGLGIFTAAVFMLPFGWENTLWGFQSLFYFVLLWGLLGIGCCWRYATLSRGWWLGVAILGLGLFSMAGGVLAPVVAGGLVGLRAVRNRADWRRECTGVLVLGALTIAGFLLVPHVPGSDSLRAHSLVHFLEVLQKIAAWPARPHFVILIQSPLVLLLAWALWRRLPATDQAWLFITLGLWSWAQTAAIVFGRMEWADSPRYTDTYAFALCVSFACLLHLAIEFRGRLKLPLLLLAAVWLGVTGRQLRVASKTLPSYLALKLDRSRAQESTVREFLATGDRAALRAKPASSLPYPDPDMLAAYLENPTLRDILPGNLRAPLTPEAVTIHHGAFRADGWAPGTPGLLHESAWGSHDPVTGGSTTGFIELKFPAAGRTSWLEFSLAGTPGASGISLSLMDAQGRSRAIPARAGSEAQWQTVRIPRPTGPFTLRVTDDNPAAWVAFTLPREVGPLTLATDWLQKQAILIGILGIALTGIAVWAEIARSGGKSRALQ